MKEYIERKELLKRLKYKRDNDTDYSRKKYPGLESAIAQVIKAPRVDVVEVVRCKDCIHMDKGWCCFHDMSIRYDDYCSFGERVNA